MTGSTYRRLAIALVLGGLLLLSPPAVTGGLFWDLGIAAGYVCIALALFLYIFPLRGDGLPHGRLLGLSQHRVIGWWMLGAAAFHVAVLLCSQPSIGRYLLPSAPLFMWFGVLAVVLAAVLVQTGLSARSAMRRSPGRAETRVETEARRLTRLQSHVPVQTRAQTAVQVHAPRSATLHVVLAAVMVLALCAHIMGSRQLVGGAGKAVAVVLLLLAPLAWFAFRPRNPRSHQTILRRLSHVSAVALIPLMPSPTASSLLLEPAVRPKQIAVIFPHELHLSVNCVTCHHNYIDHTGVMACIECHRAERTDLPHSSEATFHTFCRDCHTQLALDGAKHGPTRACSACH